MGARRGNVFLMGEVFGPKLLLEIGENI